jgi:hypothetical protein
LLLPFIDLDRIQDFLDFLDFLFSQFPDETEKAQSAFGGSRAGQSSRVGIAYQKPVLLRHWWTKPTLLAFYIPLRVFPSLFNTLALYAHLHRTFWSCAVKKLFKINHENTKARNKTWKSSYWHFLALQDKL